MTKEIAIEKLEQQQELYAEGTELYVALSMAIEALSAPQIIYCKDCKYFKQYTDEGTFESVLKMHQWDGECSEWVGHTYMDWFCSRAKGEQNE